MSFRLKLGLGLEDISVGATKPSVRFSGDGRTLTITLPIHSSPTPDEPIDCENDKRHTYRDILETAGGTGGAYGGNVKAWLWGDSDGASTLMITMDVSSKVPGTGVGLINAKNVSSQ